MKGVASFASVGSFAADAVIPYRTAQLLTLGINQDPPNPSPEAREHRQAETIRRLVDTIPRLDPDEDIGPYIDDHGFRLPEPGEDEE
jgi:hypothetical protein